MKNYFVKSSFLILIACLLNQNYKAQIITLLNEDFSTNSFASNAWTFPNGQGNWLIGSSNTPSGGTAPNAFFNWATSTSNYSCALLSNTINATAITGPVTLDYLLLFNPYSTATLEQFKVEYKDISSSTWTLLTNYTNSVTSITNWSVTNTTLAGVSGLNFQIRFTAYGVSSFNITRWSLDNIVVKGTSCLSTIPNLTLVSTPTICSGASATLTAIGGGTSFTWSPAGGNGSVAIVSPTVNTTYALVSSMIGCTATPVSAVATVTVYSNTTSLTTTSSSSLICAGSAVTLTAAGATSYSWNTGTTSSSISVSPTVSSVYSVSNTNSLGCVATKTINITVNPNPVLSIYSTSSVTCSGAINNLIASGASTYTWSNNANTSIITVSPQVTTTYTLIGTNAQGCSSTSTVSALVSPMVGVAASNTSICFGSSTTLNASGANTYTWSNSYNTNSIIVSPTTNIVYTVVATDNNACITSASIAVLVHANPTVTALSSNTSICSGNAATLTASGASTYTWNGFLTGSSIVVSPNNNTTYSVLGTSANGCNGSNNSATINLSVLPIPTVTAASSNSVVCAGYNLTLTANGASTYSWSFGASSNTATVSPLTSSIFTVTGTDSQLCSSNATVYVTVLPSPSLTIASSGTNLCVGQTVMLLANGAQTYTWNTGANVNVIYVAPNSNTIYTINGTGINGCIGTETINLVVNQYPTLTVNTGDTLICAGESVNLNASGALSYEWSNLMSGSSITVTPLTTTIYTVIGSNNGCDSYNTIVQKVDECTGIDNYINTKNLFSVFPNPNNGLITIHLNTIRSKTYIEIYSVAGQLILSKELNTERFTLDLNEHASGIYYLKVINSESQNVLKIIKE